MKVIRIVASLTLSCALAPGCGPSTGELATEVATVTVTPSSAELEVGKSLAVVSSVMVNNSPTDRARDWTSSDESVAGVSKENDSAHRAHISARKPGTATITVSYKEFSAKVVVTVVPAPPYVVQVTPPNATLEVGATLDVTAIPQPASLSFIDGTKDIGWDSDNKAIATVVSTAKQKAKVTAVAPGVVRITADVIGEPGGQGSTTILVVSTAKATSLTLTPSSLEIGMGETGGFTCTALNAQGTAMANAALQWSSSTPGVATVATGRVTAVSPGTSTITCLEPNSGLTKTAVVTVRARVLKVSPSTVTIARGDGQQVVPVVEDFRGTVLASFDKKTIIWKSDEPQIAQVFVNADGSVNIQGNGEGATIVTATLPNDETRVAIPVSVTSATGCRGTTTITYNVAVVSDPGGRAPSINLGSTKTMSLALSDLANNPAFKRLDVTAAAPFVAASGNVNQTTCALIATGIGTIGGSPNIKAELSGSYPAGGKLVLTYKVFMGGETNAGLTVTYSLTQQ